MTGAAAGGREPGSYLFGRVFTTKLARLHVIRPAFAPPIPCSRALNRRCK